MRKAPLLQKKIQKHKKLVRGPISLNISQKSKNRTLGVIATTLLTYQCLALSSCYLLPKKQEKHISHATCQKPPSSNTSHEEPFPNILENLENAPPFGDPILYKTWKKEQKTTP